MSDFEITVSSEEAENNLERLEDRFERVENAAERAQARINRLHRRMNRMGVGNHLMREIRALDRIRLRAELSLRAPVGQLRRIQREVADLDRSVAVPAHLKLTRGGRSKKALLAQLADGALTLPVNLGFGTVPQNQGSLNAALAALHGEKWVRLRFSDSEKDLVRALRGVPAIDAAPRLGRDTLADRMRRRMSRINRAIPPLRPRLNAGLLMRQLAALEARVLAAALRMRAALAVIGAGPLALPAAMGRTVRTVPRSGKEADGIDGAPRGGPPAPIAHYKGREYRVLYRGNTRHGRRAKLQYLSGTKTFWVDESRLQEAPGNAALPEGSPPGRQVPSPYVGRKPVPAPPHPIRSPQRIPQSSVPLPTPPTNLPPSRAARHPEAALAADIANVPAGKPVVSWRDDFYYRTGQTRFTAHGVETRIASVSDSEARWAPVSELRTVSLPSQPSKQPESPSPPGPRFYTGVGSRKTPPPILRLMTRLAEQKAQEGVILRSGGARGANRAFEAGSRGRKQIFRPMDASPAAIVYALKRHGAPAAVKKRFSDNVRRLMGRNVLQVLGPDPTRPTPSEFVMAWTPDGAETHAARGIDTGGTGTAISVANDHGIPVYNLGNERTLRRILRTPVGAAWLKTELARPENRWMDGDPRRLLSLYTASPPQLPDPGHLPRKGTYRERVNDLRTNLLRLRDRAVARIHAGTYGMPRSMEPDPLAPDYDRMIAPAVAAWRADPRNPIYTLGQWVAERFSDRPKAERQKMVLGHLENRLNDAFRHQLDHDIRLLRKAHPEETGPTGYEFTERERRYRKPESPDAFAKRYQQWEKAGKKGPEPVRRTGHPPAEVRGELWEADLAELGRLSPNVYRRLMGSSAITVPVGAVHGVGSQDPLYRVGDTARQDMAMNERIRNFKLPAYLEYIWDQERDGLRVYGDSAEEIERRSQKNALDAINKAHASKDPFAIDLPNHRFSRKFALNLDRVPSGISQFGLLSIGTGSAGYKEDLYNPAPVSKIPEDLNERIDRAHKARSRHLARGRYRLHRLFVNMYKPPWVGTERADRSPEELAARKAKYREIARMSRAVDDRNLLDPDYWLEEVSLKSVAMFPELAAALEQERHMAMGADRELKQLMQLQRTAHTRGLEDLAGPPAGAVSQALFDLDTAYAMLDGQLKQLERKTKYHRDAGKPIRDLPELTDSMLEKWQHGSSLMADAVARLNKEGIAPPKPRAALVERYEQIMGAFPSLSTLIETGDPDRKRPRVRPTLKDGTLRKGADTLIDPAPRVPRLPSTGAPELDAAIAAAQERMSGMGFSPFTDLADLPLDDPRIAGVDRERGTLYLHPDARTLHRKPKRSLGRQEVAYDLLEGRPRTENLIAHEMFHRIYNQLPEADKARVRSTFSIPGRIYPTRTMGESHREMFAEAGALARMGRLDRVPPEIRPLVAALHEGTYRLPASVASVDAAPKAPPMDPDSALAHLKSREPTARVDAYLPFPPGTPGYDPAGFRREYEQLRKNPLFGGMIDPLKQALADTVAMEQPRYGFLIDRDMEQNERALTALANRYARAQDPETRRLIERAADRRNRRLELLAAERAEFDHRVANRKMEALPPDQETLKAEIQEQEMTRKRIFARDRKDRLITNLAVDEHLDYLGKQMAARAYYDRITESAPEPAAPPQPRGSAGVLQAIREQAIRDEPAQGATAGPPPGIQVAGPAPDDPARPPQGPPPSGTGPPGGGPPDGVDPPHRPPQKRKGPSLAGHFGGVLDSYAQTPEGPGGHTYFPTRVHDQLTAGTRILAWHREVAENNELRMKLARIHALRKDPSGLADPAPGPAGFTAFPAAVERALAEGKTALHRQPMDLLKRVLESKPFRSHDTMVAAIQEIDRIRKDALGHVSLRQGRLDEQRSREYAALKVSDPSTDFKTFNRETLRQSQAISKEYRGFFDKLTGLADHLKADLARSGAGARRRFYEAHMAGKPLVPKERLPLADPPPEAPDAAQRRHHEAIIAANRRRPNAPAPGLLDTLRRNTVFYHNRGYEFLARGRAKLREGRQNLRDWYRYNLGDADGFPEQIGHEQFRSDIDRMTRRSPEVAKRIQAMDDGILKQRELEKALIRTSGTEMNRLARIRQHQRAGGRFNRLFQNFARVGMMMSGIAASLFVFQTVGVWLSMMVQVGNRMEKAFAGVAAQLDLSAAGAKRLKGEARELAAEGPATTPEVMAAQTALTRLTGRADQGRLREVMALQRTEGTSLSDALILSGGDPRFDAMRAVRRDHARRLAGTVQGSIDRFRGAFGHAVESLFDHYRTSLKLFFRDMARLISDNEKGLIRWAGIITDNLVPALVALTSALALLKIHSAISGVMATGAALGVNRTFLQAAGVGAGRLALGALKFTPLVGAAVAAGYGYKRYRDNRRIERRGDSALATLEEMRQDTYDPELYDRLKEDLEKDLARLRTQQTPMNHITTVESAGLREFRPEIIAAQQARQNQISTTFRSGALAIPIAERESALKKLEDLEKHQKTMDTRLAKIKQRSGIGIHLDMPLKEITKYQEALKKETGITTEMLTGIREETLKVEGPALTNALGEFYAGILTRIREFNIQRDELLNTDPRQWAAGERAFNSLTVGMGDYDKRKAEILRIFGGPTPEGAKILEVFQASAATAEHKRLKTEIHRQTKRAAVNAMDSERLRDILNARNEFSINKEFDDHYREILEKEMPGLYGAIRSGHTAEDRRALEALLEGGESRNLRIRMGEIDRSGLAPPLRALLRADAERQQITARRITPRFETDHRKFLREQRHLVEDTRGIEAFLQVAEAQLPRIAGARSLPGVTPEQHRRIIEFLKTHMERLSRQREAMAFQFDRRDALYFDDRYMRQYARTGDLPTAYGYTFENRLSILKGELERAGVSAPAITRTVALERQRRGQTLWDTEPETLALARRQTFQDFDYLRLTGDPARYRRAREAQRREMARTFTTRMGRRPTRSLIDPQSERHDAGADILLEQEMEKIAAATERMEHYKRLKQETLGVQVTSADLDHITERYRQTGLWSGSLEEQLKRLRQEIAGQKMAMEGLDEEMAGRAADSRVIPLRRRAVQPAYDSREEMLRHLRGPGDFPHRQVITRHQYNERIARIREDAALQKRYATPEEGAAIDRVREYREEVEVLNLQAESPELTDRIAAGARMGFLEYERTAVTTAETVKQAYLSMFQGLEDVLTRFVTTGKLRFNDLIVSMLSDLARAQIRENVVKPFSGFLNTVFTGFVSSLGGGLFNGLFGNPVPASTATQTFDSGARGSAMGGLNPYTPMGNPTPISTATQSFDIGARGPLANPLPDPEIAFLPAIQPIESAFLPPVHSAAFPGAEGPILPAVSDAPAPQPAPVVNEVHVTINAIDSADVAAWASRNADVLGAAVVQDWESDGITRRRMLD